MKTDISIIIVNYNTPIHTSNCLKSIERFQESFEFTYEILLVDNAPKEDCKDLFLSCCTTPIQYIKSAQNIGFGPANNLAMERAKGTYFLLLNSDTLLIDASINNAFQYLEDKHQAAVGLLGCRLLNEDLSYQHSYYPYTGNRLWDYFKANNPIFSKLFKAALDFQQKEGIRTVGDVSGAFMLLRKVVFEQCKGFDPDFFLYCEETEWCRNRIAKQFSIVYFPDTRIIHLGGKSAPKAAMQIQSAISEYLFRYKTGWLPYCTYMLIQTFNLLTQFLLYPFTKSKATISLKFLWKQYHTALYYAFFEIPKYPKAFAARKKALYYKKAKSIFFPTL